MPYPANLPPIGRIELLRQANEARNAVVVSGLQRILSGFAGWMQRRRAETELRAMTDRELADIGLTRGTIRAALGTVPGAEAAVDRPAARPPVAAAPAAPAAPANDSSGTRTAA